jgi:hypothetical protein
MIGRFRIAFHDGSTVDATLGDNGRWACADADVASYLDLSYDPTGGSPADGAFGYKVFWEAVDDLEAEVLVAPGSTGKALCEACVVASVERMADARAILEALETRARGGGGRSGPGTAHDPHSGRFTFGRVVGPSGGKILGHETADEHRRGVADRAERYFAGLLHGKRLKDYEAYDVWVRKPGGGHHIIEVKTMQHGAENRISVREWALYRKAEHARTHPKDTFHTIVVDLRHKTEGGIHAARYSGHTLYYKRASGRYSLSKMHKVDSTHDIKRLLNMPSNKLPKEAHGVFPKGAALRELKAKGEKTRDYEITRSKERRQKPSSPY